MFGRLKITILALGVVSCSSLPVQAQQLSEGRAIFSPVAQATISAELASVVREMPFYPGTEFVQGDVLVKLDCRLFDAQARQAQAEYEIARLRAENAAELVQRNSIGRVEAEVAAQEYAKRKAAERVARLNSDRCEVHAPFDGRVANWQAHPHERAEPGMPLLQIVGSDRLQVEIVAGTDWVGRVKAGDPVAIKMDHSGATAEATVRAFAPEMDPVSQTLTVYAQLDETDGLLGGMTGTATALPDSRIATD